MELNKVMNGGESWESVHDSWWLIILSHDEIG